MTIQRDAFGVPFINGATFDDVEYGAGYAAIEDRMFLMDVLRHTGAARMAEFVGNTPGNVAMDQAQLRSAYYTPAEANAQVLRPPRTPAPGVAAARRRRRVRRGHQPGPARPVPDRRAPDLPCGVRRAAEDADRLDPRRHRLHRLAGRRHLRQGRRQGGRNAKWWQSLKAKFGTKEALKIYGDLREKNDPEAPTTSSKSAPYDGAAFHPGRPGVALPDRGGATAPGTGAVLRGSAPAPADGEAAGSTCPAASTSTCPSSARTG